MLLILFVGCQYKTRVYNTVIILFTEIILVTIIMIWNFHAVSSVWLWMKCFMLYFSCLVGIIFTAEWEDSEESLPEMIVKVQYSTDTCVQQRAVPATPLKPHMHCFQRCQRSVVVSRPQEIHHYGCLQLTRTVCLNQLWCADSFSSLQWHTLINQSHNCEFVFVM